MRIFSLIIVALLLSSCSKPDPNPELKDPIFADLQATLDTTAKSLETERKNLEGHEKELREAVPQTGQIKFAQKRVNETKERITRLGQEMQYLEMKIEARKRLAKKSYAESFKNGQPWPDPKEWESYSAEKRLRNAKRNWDVKERMKELSPTETKTPESKESGGKH